MKHVDAFSRHHILVVDDNSFEQNLILAQTQDEEIKELMKKLELREDKFYEMRNGILYRKMNDKLLFYVPKTMVNNVLHVYHDGLGHCGITKTCDAIGSSYWFPT